MPYVSKAVFYFLRQVIIPYRLITFYEAYRSPQTYVLMQVLVVRTQSRSISTPLQSEVLSRIITTFHGNCFSSLTSPVDEGKAVAPPVPAGAETYHESLNNPLFIKLLISNARVIFFFLIVFK
jgi:hypothetical protein